MSTTITNAFITQYADDVKDEFQRKGSFLLQTVRRENDVKGSTFDFYRIGTGAATTKARHGTITPMNQTHTSVPCTLSDFYAGDWVDKLDENKVSINERQALARGGAFALGRKADDQILTAMNAEGSNIVSGAAVTRGILLEAVETLDGNDVPRDGRRFGLLTPRQWSTAMTISEFADADFVGGSDDLPFIKGAEPRTWLGVHWMVHTGLPGKGTNAAVLFVYHLDAIGYAMGEGITPDITWHGDRASHFVNHMMSGGSCVIEGNGLIEIQVDDTTAIPTS